MLNIKQTNRNNIGIPKDQFLMGYREGDALYFDQKDPVHAMHESTAQIANSFANFNTVLDVGSGSGGLCYFLRKINPSVTTVTLDGNPKSADSPFIIPEKHLVVRTDEEYKLVNEKNETVKFYLICSFEHFEHINPDTFEVFLNNIKQHSHATTLIWVTAAAYKFVKEHEAHVHCNVKSYEEWALFLKKCGFEILPASPLRQNMSSLHQDWLPPHGRLGCSHEFLLKIA